MSLRFEETEWDPDETTLKMSRALKQEDERGLSKLYEAEFNKPDLHDRVLIFDVVARFRDESVEENVCNKNKEIVNKATTESDDEATKSENVPVEMCAITSDASQDSDISPKGDEQIKNESSYEDNRNETLEADIYIEDDTVSNENVETNQNTSNKTKMSGQYESKITRNENPKLDDKGQSGKEILSESEEGTSYPSGEGKIIRQHKFYIHSTWLAVQSSYFRSLFFSGMKESNAKEVHVQISTSEEQARLMLLEAMYKIDTLDNADVDELLDVLILAHKYDVKFVFNKCKYCLQAAVVSLEICEQIMCFIKIENTVITDVEDLVATLQSFLVKEFSPLDEKWQKTSFKELCEPSLMYLLNSNELITVCENTVFHALMYWIEERGVENVLESQELPSLLSAVRFELMPADYLYNIVQHHPVAKKLPDFNDHYLRGISYHALPKKIRGILPHQPVNRSRTYDFSGKHTLKWKIPRDKLDEILGNDKEVKAESWFCGYKVVFRVDQVQAIDDNYSRGDNVKTFKADLTMEITNLKQHSVVDISWYPYSKAFTHGISAETHTFKNDAPSSSVNITYRMKVLKEIPIQLAPPGSCGPVSLGSCGLLPKTTAPSEFTFHASLSQHATVTTGFNFGGLCSTGSFATVPAKQPLASVPKEKSETTPSLSITVYMKLL